MLNNKVINIKVYSDSGHAWGAVKRNLLVELGIAHLITPFSYQKGKTVYLEEDVDLTTLINTLKGRGIFYKTVEKSHANRSSPIRNYQCYQA